ncbi:hypothetical protein PILCRDRAFT_818784 [Piloderma croceum F 1598]|uniref:Uncharacterized protein n=1 Tax=Piloderma croceum (strain F 1598) TaxID=765440 RepID=A0A0C3FZU5_PILCF|nr:hypothetical protein PILCRDRAFT_818784 [Piloderma croceum F 1598]
MQMNAMRAHPFRPTLLHRCLSKHRAFLLHSKGMIIHIRPPAHTTSQSSCVGSSSGSCYKLFLSSFNVTTIDTPTCYSSIRLVNDPGLILTGTHSPNDSFKFNSKKQNSFL